MSNCFEVSRESQLGAQLAPELVEELNAFYDDLEKKYEDQEWGQSLDNEVYARNSASGAY